MLGLLVAIWVFDVGTGTPLPQAARAAPAPGLAQPRPLTRDPQAFAVARAARDVVVGLAARPGNRVDVVVYPSVGDRIGLGSVRLVSPVRQRPSSCGERCYSFRVPVLSGKPV